MSALCSFGSTTVFAIYTYDERPNKTIRARYDMEKSVRVFGLGVLPNRVNEYKDMAIITTYER